MNIRAQAALHLTVLLGALARGGCARGAAANGGRRLRERAHLRRNLRPLWSFFLGRPGDLLTPRWHPFCLHFGVEPVRGLEVGTAWNVGLMHLGLGGEYSQMSNHVDRIALESPTHH